MSSWVQATNSYQFRRAILCLCCWVAFGVSVPTLAETPRVGRAAASKYFKSSAPQTRAAATRSEDFSNALWIHLGKAMNSTSYSWEKQGKEEGVATNSFGVSYVFDELAALDLVFRADVNEYALSESKASKLSLMPVVSFPRVETRFPLYFGLGAGLGVYFQQLASKSQIALDYQLFAGVRFLDLSPGVGVFLEYGLKNHVHLLSEGQLNGSYLSLGPYFTF